MSQRFEGRNLEDALSHAAAAFGVEPFQLTHRVLVEKRGFLGGVKRIVIEAEVNEQAPAPSTQTAAPRPAAPADVAPAAAPAREAVVPAPSSAPPRRERSGGGGGGGRERGRGGRGGRDQRGGSQGGGAAASGGPRRGRQESTLESGDFELFLHESEVDPELPEQGPESEGAQLVRAWVSQVLTLARLSLEIRTGENETQINIRLYGRDGRRMIDQHGELLDAVQVLANKALVGRKVEKEIELDCLDFKQQRIEEIGEQARQTADRVRRDGREQLLPAMSPIERRIVHIALREDPQVTTESRGEGFYKRVAIFPRPPQAEADSESAEATEEP
jgi:predicted RNA-binding protein Jag